MSDLTIGDVGVTLQEQLLGQDLTQDPPVQTPLDLTNAQKVELLFLIVPPNSTPPQPPVKTVLMSILSPPTNGVVFYSFQAGDLVAPLGMGKNGVFKFSIRVTFNNGNIFYTNIDGQFSIKDDSVL
jgi:hypothetical protein